MYKDKIEKGASTSELHPCPTPRPTAPCLDERLGLVALRLHEPALLLHRMHHALEPRDEQHDRHPRRPLLGRRLLLPGGLGGAVCLCV